MDTRGLRRLKAYLGEDGAKKAKAKRAEDVVPVLAARRLQSNNTTSAAMPASAPMTPSVISYLEGRLSSGATFKLSRTQASLVKALAAQKCADSDAPQTATATATTVATSVATTSVPISVTRGRVSKLSAMIDTVALAALERAARLEAVATTASPCKELSALFVLTDDAAAVVEVAGQLEGRYGLTVLCLVDGDAPRHPTFPSVGGAGITTSKPTAAKAKKAKALDASTDGASAVSGAVVVVVASPAGFLAVDRRSAIWKFIGSFAVLFCYPDTQPTSLLASLKGSRSTPSATPQALNAQRWACLGHVSNIAVMAQEQAWLSVPAVDLLTTLSLEGGDVVPTGSTTTTASSVKVNNTAVPTVLAATRRPVTVHYTVATGTQRFQFLFSLLKGLVPHRGLVVHVATRECATFLFDALYSFLDELPPYVQLLSDYEGASAYTGMHSSADRQRLCVVFDEVVQSGKDGKSAAVLISCCGLVPRKGSVFLQYDVIPDLANYNQFLAEVLTPGAAVTAPQGEGKSPATTAASATGAVGVRRETTTRQRKRSLSPTPTSIANFSRNTSGDELTHGAGSLSTADAESMAFTSVVNYTHLLLLLRPNEERGVLTRLRQDGAARYGLTFHALPNRAGGRYLFVGEKLKSLNKKLFVIQNAAYYAYKATMRVYSTVGPRDAYDETKVHLEKVAEEFGYTELPLLDLRLKDTAFRPKEDFYRAARQKQDAERRAYKKFAKDNIIGEKPEEHVPDV
jgi:hypothetical protein